MSQSRDDIARQLDEAEESLEHLRLEDALRVAESAWRSAESMGTPSAFILSIRGRLLGARVLMHQLRLADAERLIEEARVLRRRSANNQTEDIWYAMRLLRCLRGQPRGVPPGRSLENSSRDVMSLFARCGAGLDARAHPLLKLRHHEAVLLSATSRHDLQREGYRALAAGRTLVTEGIEQVRQERENALLDLIETIFWFRFGETEKGRDFVELIYGQEPVTPLQGLRRGFVVLSEVQLDRYDDDIEDIALQFVDRCLKQQLRAIALRALTLTPTFGSDAWRATPLLEVIL